MTNSGAFLAGLSLVKAYHHRWHQRICDQHPSPTPFVSLHYAYNPARLGTYINVSDAILVAASLLSGLGSCETLYILSLAAGAPRSTALSDRSTSCISPIICRLMFSVASWFLYRFNGPSLLLRTDDIDLLARKGMRRTGTYEDIVVYAGLLYANQGYSA